jgi:hypothetical protein
MKAIAPIAVAALLVWAGAAAQAGELRYDFSGPYLQRKDSITPGAGNAKAVNTVTHMVDPWPPYAGNRRIPGNGERMAGAAERYRDASKLQLTPAPLAHPAAGQAGSLAGATSSTSSTSTSSSTTGQ